MALYTLESCRYQCSRLSYQVDVQPNAGFRDGTISLKMRKMRELSFFNCSLARESRLLSEELTNKM
jgi:hypothetical protein